MTPLQMLVGVVCVFLVVMLSVACFLIISRLAGIEENTEKISILLAVIANKQGATQEDIIAATQIDSPEKSK